MAQGASEELFGELGRVSGTGTQQVGMPQDAFDVDDPALIPLEDWPGVEHPLTQAGHADGQDALGRRQASLAIAITIPSSAGPTSVPADAKILSLKDLQGLLDPAGDEAADLVIDPVPEKVLALCGFTW